MDTTVIILRVVLGLALGLAGLESLTRGDPPGLDADTFAGWVAALGEVAGDLRGPAHIGGGREEEVLDQGPEEHARARVFRARADRLE